MNFYVSMYCIVWAVLRRRYSDWQRAGLSVDRIPVGARFSAPVQTGPGSHPASCIMGTGSFPGVKSGRCVTLTPHLLLVPLSRKSRAIPPLPVWAVRPRTEPQCLYKGALYIFALYCKRQNFLKHPMIFIEIEVQPFYGY